MLTTDRRQFICWIATPSKTRPGKTDKFPVSPHTGQVCDAHDPSQWVDRTTAQAAVAFGVGQLASYRSGIGFVFTAADPYFFFDLDNCLQDDGQWSPAAVEYCRQFAGCFMEVSASGRGLHIIGSYDQRPAHSCRGLGLELYTADRYCALTFTGAVGSVDTRAQAALTALVAQNFREKPNSPGANADWTTGPSPEWSGPTDDADLIQRLLASRPSAGSILGGRATVQDLWAGNADALGQSYPDDRPDGYDHSSADAALCSHLAFWTGKDCERMDRLFRQSGLVRDKWLDRPDYRQRTILHAVGNCQKVIGERLDPFGVPIVRATEHTSHPDTTTHPEQPGEPEPAGIDGLRGGSQFLSVPSQVSYFKGCVYVRDAHRILMPDGGLLRPEQFKATMGGYLFSMDLVNDKTTRNAWEAFTESSGYNFPRAHEACFRPECPPGHMVEEEGRVMVNTYTPISTTATPGDAGPFLGHVARLFPNPQDRAIILAYMAAVVQYPGVKFQWCPLVQGVQGNGKTLLITALARAVGQRYTHLPNPEDIANKFNSWILGKLFIGVEEVYVADRRELVNVLKPLVTNRRVDIQGKGTDQKTGDNRANFLMTTNHKDAVPVTDEDRRYAIFFTAQQQRQDLERDGMGGGYFPDLYRWADNGGYAVITHFLRTYAIPDALNPATTCHRAPVTTSTAEAQRASMGNIEQEVLEAIEEGRPGFAGGWVSSLAFDRLLDELRLASRLPRSRRRDLLQSLGYEWHPGLINGRTNNPIIDACGIAGKPKLYIKRGHLASNLTTGAEVVRHYLDAQSGSSMVPVMLAAAAGGLGVKVTLRSPEFSEKAIQPAPQFKC